MLGGLGNITGLFKQAKEIQERLAGIQRELAAHRYNGEAGGGAVVATVNGRGTLTDIRIKPEAAGDIELLEEMIKGAVSVATTKAQEASKAELAQLTGGLNLPGLGELLGSSGG